MYPTTKEYKGVEVMANYADYTGVLEELDIQGRVSTFIGDARRIGFASRK